MNGKNIIGDLMKFDKNTRLCILGGLAIGFLNGLLGAGGGIVAVPILHKIINNRKDAHINSIAVILPLCIISAVIYLMNGNTLGEIKIIPLTIAGLFGAMLGTFIMDKISVKTLKNIFSIMLIIAGVRMFFG